MINFLSKQESLVVSCIILVTILWQYSNQYMYVHLSARTIRTCPVRSHLSTAMKVGVAWQLPESSDDDQR